jgi:hypothetical protein
MWVLVLFVVGGINGAPGAVSGYGTEQACEDSGKEFVKRSIDRASESVAYICIPGPGQTGKTPKGWVGQE